MKQDNEGDNPYVGQRPEDGAHRAQIQRLREKRKEEDKQETNQNLDGDRSAHGHIKPVGNERNEGDINDIDGIRITFSDGWGLVRASNTQPVISMRFESSSKEGLLKVKNDFYTALQPYFDDQLLREKIEL